MKTMNPRRAPRTKQAPPPQAPTPGERLLACADGTPGTSLFRQRVGDEAAMRQTVQTPPSGRVNWYFWGPKNAWVTLNLVRVPNSGGHYHGGAATDALAVGRLSTTKFQLGPNYPQNYKVVYSAPDVCGEVRLIARYSLGSPSTFEHRLQVLLPGLVPIPASASLKLKAPTAAHSSPYWATPAMVAKLQKLGAQYFARTRKPITITDASLQWGGRFDLNLNWRAPHAEHMNGRQADIRSNDMTDADKLVFKTICAAVGLGVLDESNHWHVRG